MGKLYSYTYISLDGIVGSPERWVGPYFSPALGDDLATRLSSAAAMVLGKTTYAEFSSFWPNQDSSVPFAELNNGIKKLVVSATLRNTSWNNSSIVSAGDLATYKTEGNLHVTGSGILVRSLLELGLLDEIVLVQFPVLLGGGQRAFEGIQTTGLKHATTTEFPKGVQCITYKPTQPSPNAA